MKNEIITKQFINLMLRNLNFSANRRRHVDMSPAKALCVCVDKPNL